MQGAVESLPTHAYASFFTGRILSTTTRQLLAHTALQEVAPGSSCRAPGRGSLVRHCLLHHACCMHVHLQSSHVASPLASVTVTRYTYTLHVHVTQHLAIHNTCPASLIQAPNRNVALQPALLPAQAVASCCQHIKAGTPSLGVRVTADTEHV